MRSNDARREDFSDFDAESVVDNLEKFEETKLVSLEKFSNRFSPVDMKEFSTIATQTSLTFTSYFTLVRRRSSSNKRFVDSTTSPICFDQEFRESISMTVNQEAVTRATLLHSSLARSGPRTSRDTVSRISTSFFSSKFDSENEIFSLITDYDSPSSGARSVLVDAIDRNANRGLHLSAQDAYEPTHLLDLPLPNVESASNDTATYTRRTITEQRHGPRNIMRSLNNCLRCMPATNSEPDARAYMRDAPPAYSTILPTTTDTRRTSNRRPGPFQSSFTAPIPPPSYAQAQGFSLATYSRGHRLAASPNATRLWGSRPTAAICPRCTTIIVTTVQVRQSMITHITAIALFLCGCWPCCMIPYCVNTCKKIDHYCPVCRAYLGTYRPC